jgi:hypothetical protein
VRVRVLISRALCEHGVGQPIHAERKKKSVSVKLNERVHEGSEVEREMEEELARERLGVVELHLFHIAHAKVECLPNCLGDSSAGSSKSSLFVAPMTKMSLLLSPPPEEEEEETEETHRTWREVERQCGP